ncbi:RICIN domain-containing protein [Streptomyces griseorubiginosus]|uniref:RICIN domain-containing protein n=1 Tax=Streptomyces griseorubiginosus TaxID=67304 RepID=UPI0036327377
MSQPITRLGRSWRSLLSALTLTVASTLGVVTVGQLPAHAASDSVTIDGTGTGRTFDGVGAISGGGGNSRLLIDYPEPYRSQILDYLFKPGYGASLQILKVEIGGDTNSTSGSESSHEHAAGDLDCDRGYEWWLMEQAKARNPKIKLAALAWGAPGHLGTFNSTATVNYLTDWLGCASQHHLTIDYLGGSQNEKAYDKTFYENLHAAIHTAGYSTQIVGNDQVGWSIADDMLKDPAFASSVDIVGAHYPCGYLNAMSSCPSSSNAVATGKTLWASENGSQDYNAGGAPTVRAINRGYLDGKMSGYINWPIVGSIYDNVPWPTAGLIYANQPWSGYYDLGRTMWAIAHTTQVTSPGWKYIDSASGYFGGNRANGSYISYQAPDHSDYSVVAETLDATASRDVTFTVTGGLPASAQVHVWASNFNSGDMSDYWVKQSDITPNGGSFTATLKPGYAYSFTTLSTTGRGTAASPPQAPLALPYSNSFESDTPGHEPQYMAQQQGAFETVACPGGRSGQCVRQMAPTTPITWNHTGTPYTVVGNPNWTDYTVSVDAYLAQSGAVQVIGRAGAEPSGESAKMAKYYLQADDTGAWSIVKNDTDGTLTTLKSGTAGALGTGSWHKLAISFEGSTITARIDGSTVGSVTDNSFTAGEAGLGTAGYQTQAFDNLSVTAIGTPAPSGGYAVLNKKSGKALTVDSSGNITQSAYTSSSAQQWQLTGNQTGWLTLTAIGSGKVLDVPNASTGRGVQLKQWSANGGTHQQWQLRADGDGAYQILGRKAGLVADVSGGSTADGAPVIQWTANGGDNQAWTLVPVPVEGATYALTNRTSGMAMDVNGGSTADGAKVIQWPYKGRTCTWVCTAATNQQWRVQSVDSGYVKLVNINSGKVLESPDGNSGTQLDQSAYTGANTQQWRFVYNSGGYFSLANRATGYLADVSDTASQGSSVIARTSTGGNGQQWQLRPAQ